MCVCGGGQNRSKEWSQERKHCVYKGEGIRKTWHILGTTSYLMQLEYRYTKVHSGQMRRDVSRNRCSLLRATAGLRAAFSRK